MANVNIKPLEDKVLVQIVEAETTIYPGKAHSPAQDRLALWPGMGTDSGDLIQAIVLSTDKQDR